MYNQFKITISKFNNYTNNNAIDKILNVHKRILYIFFSIINDTNKNDNLDNNKKNNISKYNLLNYLSIEPLLCNKTVEVLLKLSIVSNLFSLNSFNNLNVKNTQFLDVILNSLNYEELDYLINLLYLENEVSIIYNSAKPLLINVIKLIFYFISFENFNKESKSIYCELNLNCINNNLITTNELNILYTNYNLKDEISIDIFTLFFKIKLCLIKYNFIILKLNKLQSFIKDYSYILAEHISLYESFVKINDISNLKYNNINNYNLKLTENIVINKILSNVLNSNSNAICYNINEINFYIDKKYNLKQNIQKLIFDNKDLNKRYFNNFLNLCENLDSFDSHIIKSQDKILEEFVSESLNILDDLIYYKDIGFFISKFNKIKNYYSLSNILNNKLNILLILLDKVEEHKNYKIRKYIIKKIFEHLFKLISEKSKTTFNTSFCLNILIFVKVAVLLNSTNLFLEGDNYQVKSNFTLLTEDFFKLYVNELYKNLCCNKINNNKLVEILDLDNNNNNIVDENYDHLFYILNNIAKIFSNTKSLIIVLDSFIIAIINNLEYYDNRILNVNNIKKYISIVADIGNCLLKIQYSNMNIVNRYKTMLFLRCLCCLIIHKNDEHIKYIIDKDENVSCFFILFNLLNFNLYCNINKLYSDKSNIVLDKTLYHSIDSKKFLFLYSKSQESLNNLFSLIFFSNNYDNKYNSLITFNNNSLFKSIIDFIKNAVDIIYSNKDLYIILNYCTCSLNQYTNISKLNKIIINFYVILLDYSFKISVIDDKEDFIKSFINEFKNFYINNNDNNYYISFDYSNKANNEDSLKSQNIDINKSLSYKSLIYELVSSIDYYNNCFMHINYNIINENYLNFDIIILNFFSAFLSESYELLNNIKNSINENNNLSINKLICLEKNKLYYYMYFSSYLLNNSSLIYLFLKNKNLKFEIDKFEYILQNINNLLLDNNKNSLIIYFANSTFNSDNLINNEANYISLLMSLYNMLLNFYYNKSILNNVYALDITFTLNLLKEFINLINEKDLKDEIFINFIVAINIILKNNDIDLIINKDLIELLQHKYIQKLNNLINNDIIELYNQDYYNMYIDNLIYNIHQVVNIVSKYYINNDSNIDNLCKNTLNTLAIFKSIILKLLNLVEIEFNKNESNFKNIFVNNINLIKYIYLTSFDPYLSILLSKCITINNKKIGDKEFQYYYDEIFNVQIDNKSNFLIKNPILNYTINWALKLNNEFNYPFVYKELVEILELNIRNYFLVLNIFENDFNILEDISNIIVCLCIIKEKKGEESMFIDCVVPNYLFRPINYNSLNVKKSLFNTKDISKENIYKTGFYGRFYLLISIENILKESNKYSKYTLTYIVNKTICILISKLNEISKDKSELQYTVTHRTKLRISQLLILLLVNISNKDFVSLIKNNNDLISNSRELFYKMNLQSVKFYTDIYFSKLAFLDKDFLIEILDTINNYNSKQNLIQSSIVIIGYIINFLLYSNNNSNNNYISLNQELIGLLIKQLILGSTSNHCSIRSSSQYFIYKFYKKYTLNFKTKNKLSIDSNIFSIIDMLYNFINNSGQINKVFERFETIYSEAYSIYYNKESNFNLSLHLIEKNLDEVFGEIVPFDIFNEFKILSNNILEINTEDYQNPLSSWKMYFNLHNLNKKSCLELENNTCSNKNNDINYNEHNSNNYQLKYKPIDENNLNKCFTNKRRLDVIVIASLLEKIPNLGGLARTCEVFNIGSLVINNSSILKDNQFTSAAASADKWLPINIVPKQDLVQYLNAYKLIGYKIIGLEQTSNSVDLDSFKFLEKCIIIMGNEKLGMPQEIIDLLDYSVFIKQYGKIRSLNVHVSVSILLQKLANNLNK